jgi:hypothetical protein
VVTVAYSAGNLVGAVSVAAIAAAPSYGWFMAAWLMAGIASAGRWRQRCARSPSTPPL